MVNDIKYRLYIGITLYDTTQHILRKCDTNNAYA